MNKEYGPIEARYTETPSGHPEIAARDGAVKPGTVFGGPEKAGVAMRGIHMDAAGDLKAKPGEQKLTPGLKSVVKHGTPSIFL